MFRYYRVAITSIVFLLLLLGITNCTKQPEQTPEIPLPTAAIVEPTLTPTTPAGPAVHEIQGATHTSPLLGKKVENVIGIVTTFRADGFYLQDLNPDSDPATSEGLFIFTQLPPRARAGMIVSVAGVVSEIYPGGIEAGGLSITQITSPKVTEISKDNVLPLPIIIGEGGVVPPSQHIDNDRMREFNPTEDGIDFYESLESMLVQVNDAIVVGPTTAYKEIAIVGDSGKNAGLLSERGVIVIQDSDFNPERILLDDSLRSTPNANVGDRFDQPVVGIIDYTFGNFKLQPIIKLNVVPGDITRESARPSADNELSIAAYNGENLDALDDQSRFDHMGEVIVNRLQSPDIVSLSEVQDNNGPFADDNVSADETYQKIIAAITAAGGPIYEYRDIAPIVNMDGGEAGGNIRVGFLFRTDRGLSFVDKPVGDSHTPVELVKTIAGVSLSFNPGRIDPMNSAFADSRKPLAGEFVFRGNRIIVIANHLNSKGGDTYLFGDQQPPFLSSEIQRVKQGTVLNAFVKEALALDPQTRIVILGDLNDFQFSKPIEVLVGSEMTSLVMTLPAEERYTYNYDGNAQVLDHIVVTNNMMGELSEFDIVHFNSEFYYGNRGSDHDAVIARFVFE